MTEKQLRSLFDIWKHRLGLDLWYLEIKIEPTKRPSSIMDISRSSTYNRAVVRIPPWLMDGKPPEELLPITITDERIEESVVHELLHCVRHYTHAMVMDRIDGQVHRDVYTVVTEEFEATQELEIENLAVALVKSWPK